MSACQIHGIALRAQLTNADFLGSTSLMFRFLLLPILSLLPCVLWLWYFYTRSIWKRDPLHLVALTFVLGGASTLIALPLNLLGQSLILNSFGADNSARLLTAFLVVGPVEEFCKLLAVYVYAWRHQEFDEPLDGVIYSAAAALGFAAAENIIYLSQNDPSLVLLRGPLSNPGHALFSALWGLSLSRVRAAPNILLRRFVILMQGFLLAVVLHAGFDALLVQTETIGPILYPVIVGAMVALFLWVRSRIHFHRETSPHREGTVLLTLSVACPGCGKPGLAGTSCLKCGFFIPERELEIQIVEPEPSPAEISVQRKSRPRLITRATDKEENIAWLLNESEIFVGRTLNNNFVIEHPSVSRRHARIVVSNGSHKIYDLESRNGTFVNGRRVSEATLQDGCEVKFGSVSFVYRH